MQIDMYYYIRYAAYLRWNSTYGVITPYSLIRQMVRLDRVLVLRLVT